MNKRSTFLQMPRELLKEFIILTLINLAFGLMMDAGSFLLQFSKNAMIEGHVVLSLVLISLHYVKFPLENFTRTFVEEREDIFREHKDIFLTKNAADVLLRVKGKVQHRNELQGFDEKMPSSKILKTCHEFLANTWEIRTFFLRNGIDIVSAVIMFIGLLAVSTLEVEHTGIFIILVIVSSIFELLFCNIRLKTRNTYRNQQRKARMITEEARQNIMLLEPISNEHALFITNNYVDASKKSFLLQRTVQRRINLIRTVSNLATSFFTLSLLALKIWEVGFANVNLETLVSAISLVTIYSQFTRRISGFIYIGDNWREIKEERLVYENDFDNIFAVYEKQTENDDLEVTRLSRLSLPAFRVTYASTNGNQPFELISSDIISMKPGDFAVLTGTTGSGKSTLIKMLTSNLHFDGFALNIEKEKEGNTKSILHQDKTMLGSNSILKEITLGKADYDREKLLQILCGLHLYQEISEKTDDVFAFLDNSGTDQYSSGQVQRLSLARTLMNLDDTVQIVAFDEATNNLNDEIGLQVLRFIKEMCTDKVVLFATHQTNIAYEVATMHLHFEHSENDMSYHVNMV
ncbi:MAG: ATP-binding cassette domain-containing protein [Clostridia bacterium]|nr:ATP-binding cassette domain-containing protein [Clostridia bacterium]